jgi:cytochrome c553
MQQKRLRPVAARSEYMYKLTPAALAACFLFAAPSYAANVAAGKALAEDGCVDCHGDDGKGDEDNPAINGWAVDKFVKAMKEYQDGTRTKNQKMIKAAKKLDDKQIADLAAFYATLK